MRVVLDTNVFVSGVFFTGPPYEILKAWHDGTLKLVVTAEILEEYQRVGTALAERFPLINMGPILEWLAVKAEMVRARVLPEPVCTDPSDDKFLACALASKTKMIVSGDKHLLRVSGFRGIKVLRPRVFVDEFLKPSGTAH